MILPEPASRTALVLVIWHIVSIAFAMLCENWHNNNRFRLIFIFFIGVIASGCQTAPIKVTELKSEVTAVREQNKETIKHVKTFSDRNKKTITHIDKSKESGVKEAESLQSVKQALEELLGQ